MKGEIHMRYKIYISKFFGGDQKVFNLATWEFFNGDVSKFKCKAIF